MSQVRPFGTRLHSPPVMHVQCFEDATLGGVAFGDSCQCIWGKRVVEPDTRRGTIQRDQVRDRRCWQWQRSLVKPNAAGLGM